MNRFLALVFVMIFSVGVFAESIPTRGQTNSDIQITMFLDYQCPYSKRGNETIDALLRELQNNFSFSVRHFPLDFHPQAHFASKIAICAGEQGKFFEMHDKIYSLTREEFTLENILKSVAGLGMNVETHRKCLDSNLADKIIERDMIVAKNFEVRGTPTFVIVGPKGSKVLVGAYPKEEILEIINNLR